MYWQIKISEYNVCVKIYFVYPLLMSVASKTKTKRYTTVVLGLLVALSALPTWANTSPGIETTTVNQPVVSTQWTQDLSVLRTKLKERFSWISQEVVDLVQWTTSVGESFHTSADIRVIDVQQGIWMIPVNFSQDFFVDSENDPYKTYINRLSAYGVLSTSQKFYPQNYFRADDFVWLLTKIYQKKYNQALDIDGIEWIVWDTTIMTKWLLQQIMMTLDIDDIQIDGNPYDKLIRSEWAYYLVRMFDLPGLTMTEQKDAVVVSDYFTDVIGHPFAWAINTLASLDIVSSQTSKFYPDNYLRHYDFVTIFVNSLLRTKEYSLDDTVPSSFSDVESSAAYLPQLMYATDRGLIDDIVASRRWQLYFEPNLFMTKNEVYQIVSKALDIQFSYDPVQADQEKMTRAEMAQLMVMSFWFEPKIIETESDSTDENADITLINTLKVLLSMIE